jgi:hypothetical protein
LRRFTDERARDVSETIALYDDVRSKFLASVWSQEDIIERVNTVIAERVADVVDLPASPTLLRALDTCQQAILRLETTLFTAPNAEWNIATLSLKEQVDLRRFLRAQQHFLANDDRISTMLVDALGNVFAGIISELPAIPSEEADTAAFTAPLVSLMPDPGGTIQRVTNTLCKGELGDAGLFATLLHQLWRNICAASGVLPDSEIRKPLTTADECNLPPAEIAETYLGGTPFVDLFLCPIPFTIPEHVRFEHTHIVAGTGHGKTQTLQHLIAHDLARDPDEVPSLVVIDSQGDLLSKLSRLDCFDPEHGALADRLVVIDPTDVEHPPALGLFDLDLARVRGYDARYREQIMNGVIELYDYIFGGLLGAELTQKQSVIFRYLARLMLAIPDATILTLKDVMQDSAPFAHHFDKLDGMAREFFRSEFNDKQFADTKKQILRRLWGVLENPTFERLFSHPRNKLDMFEALNSGKIVLVNTAKDFLKAERSSILGRFFIALTFQAAMERAAVPEHARRPAFLYIDEAADYFDDTIDSLLTQARKFRLGVVFAHQYLDQLPRALEASIMTNTSIKFAGGVSSADAHKLAPNMGTTHDFLSKIRKRSRETDFAVYIRNVTANAITLTVPFGTLEAMPRMSSQAFADVLATNRRRYATSRVQARPIATDLVTSRPASTTPTVTDETSSPAADDWRS